MEPNYETLEELAEDIYQSIVSKQYYRAQVLSEVLKDEIFQLKNQL